MRKVLLITGASEQDRDRFIRYRQNTETCELRSILPLCNEYILNDIENGKIFFTETSGSGHRRKELQDKEVFPSWSAVINTHIVVIGNTDTPECYIPPEVSGLEDYDAAFTFGILLSAGELHNSWMHTDAEIAWRVDQLFAGRIGNILYDFKTRTGVASIRGTPPDVGTIRLLPT